MVNQPSEIFLQKLPAPTTATCKCCGQLAALVGVVDFHKNCEDRRQHPLELSGIPIYYHRCANCGFLFTIAFDDFTPHDFASRIYNEQYILVDPEYTSIRPQKNARAVHSLFPHSPDLLILDYGAGSGILAQLLRELGFKNVSSYDPFSPSHSTPPAGKFDLVVCFEVMEHTPNPRHAVSDILRLVQPPGIVLFSTLFQPADILQLGTNWWYVAPRNGHVSIFTAPAMNALLAPHNYKLASFNSVVHLLYQTPPPWAAHLFGSPPK